MSEMSSEEEPVSGLYGLMRAIDSLTQTTREARSDAAQVQGMQNIVESNEAIEQAIRDQTRSITAMLDMFSRYASNPAAASAAAGASDAVAAYGETNPLAGYTTGSSLQDVQGGFTDQAMGQLNQPGEGTQYWDAYGMGGYGPGGVGYGAIQGPGGGPLGGGFGGYYAGGGMGAMFMSQNEHAGGGGNGGAYGGGPGTGGQGAPAAPTGVRSTAPGLGGALNSLVRNNVPGANVYFGLREELLSQTAKNNAYRSVTGGSHWDAVQERFGEEGDVWSNLLEHPSTVTDEQVRQARHNAVALGFTEARDDNPNNPRPSLGQAEDFQTNLIARTGMSSNDAADALAASTRNTAVSLRQLEEALVGVSRTAQQTGTNAELMRKRFLQLFDQFTPLAGGQATTFASMVSQGTASYGQAFASTADISGNFGYDQGARIAANNNWSLNDVAAMRRTNPTQYAQMVSNLNKQDIALQVPAPWMRIINEELQRRTQQLGHTPSNEELRVAAQNALERQNESDVELTGIDETGIQSIIEGTLNQAPGSLGDPVNAVQVLMSNLQSTDAAQAAVDATGMTDSHGNLVSTGQRPAGADPKADPDDYLNDQKNQAYNNLGWGDKLDPFNYTGWHTETSAFHAYDQWRDANDGQHNRVMESILGQVDEDMADQKVLIKTDKGYRKVSLEDAIKSAPGQIVTGQATWAEGENIGQPLTDLSTVGNASTDKDFLTMAEKEASDKDVAKLGSAASQGEIDRISGGGGGEIRLAGDAKYYFEFIKGQVNQSQLTGNLPTNTNTTQGSR